MLEMQLRQAATVLLESAIRIAPPDTREWGRAMMGELDYVEGSWAGTMWALGSSGVLAKRAIVSLIIPSSRGQDFIPDGGLFAKSATLRKAALVIGGACVLAALLFFAAPPFRQAFKVALEPWLTVMHVSSADAQQAFKILARKAEARRDADGLAFCAIRTSDPNESARLAKAAIRLDPKLIWIYAVLAFRDPANPEFTSHLEALEQYDPQNSLFHLIAAEAIVRAGHSGPIKMKSLNDAWQRDMGLAFASPHFEDYSLRVAQLTRTVVPRYGLFDPFEVQARTEARPQFLLFNTEKYAENLVRAGELRAAQGDRQGARELAWTVARFGEMLDSQAHTDYEHRVGTSLQSFAYGRLEKSAAAEGDQEQAELFGYLASKFDAASGREERPAAEPAFGRETALRNAAVVEVSGLMIMVFLLLGAIAVVIVVAGSRSTASLVALRAKPVAVIVLLTSALGALFSSVTLYLTYRPYWYIFHRAVLEGDELQTPELQEFLSSMQALPGTPHRSNALLNALFYSGSPGFLFYVWAGVTLLGVIGLALILLRHFFGQTWASPPPKRRP